MYSAICRSVDIRLFRIRTEARSPDFQSAKTVLLPTLSFAATAFQSFT
ncbi:Uncharacterised protein [Mycolicibacterium fortuitum]|uniref:Uncharacterized protein n=1 Tax=Mycolicibacterium fortuitum TaxID=1766 RepID=A0A378V2V1_MYCFO|nr:Uncharacterised protein [Mycolicibacterium fortuitum]